MHHDQNEKPKAVHHGKRWNGRHKHLALEDDGSPHFNVVVDLKVAINGKLAKDFNFATQDGYIVSLTMRSVQDDGTCTYAQQT